MYCESAGEFGQSAHDGLMRRGASLNYSGKGDPMTTRVEGGGKKARQKEKRVQAMRAERNKDEDEERRRLHSANYVM